MLALMFSKKLSEEGFDVPMKRPSVIEHGMADGLSLGHIPEGVKTGLDDHGREVQYTHAAAVNYFDGGQNGFTISDEVSQYFPDTNQVGMVDVERIVKDQNGKSVNQDKWAEWGYIPA